MMRVIDLKDSPYSNSTARNGFDSVSVGRVMVLSDFPGTRATPHCIAHGAMNKVDPSGLWRCFVCNVGCFQLDDTNIETINFIEKKYLNKRL